MVSRGSQSGTSCAPRRPRGRAPGLDPERVLRVAGRARRHGSIEGNALRAFPPGRAEHPRTTQLVGILLDLTWLNLVSSCGGLYGADDGSGVVVEWGGGVQDVVAGLDGDAAVAP
jgi:hypothetical protein